MTLAVKRRTVGPHHHKRIRVRQQAHLIAILPQAHDAVQVALRHIVSIAVPSLVALLHAHFPTRHSAHLGSKLFLRDAPGLQVGKHALLHKSIQSLSGILQSYPLEPLDTSFQTQCQHYAAQVKCYILNLLRFHLIIYIVPLQRYEK